MAYALQRGYQARRAPWISFDFASDFTTAREMLRKAKRLFPDYRWRIQPLTS